MKSILITGCSTGIGRATAIHFSNRGYKVFAGVRKDSDAESLKAADVSGNIQPLMLDVTIPEQLVAAVAQVTEQLSESGLDALVNNAGLGKGGPFEFVDPDVVREAFEVNTMGPILMTQAFLPLIRKATGRIVTVGSIAGKLAAPIQGPYCVSKFAVEAFNDSLRMELAPFGIHVSLIEPGPIATPMLKGVDEAAEEAIKSLPPEGVQYYGDVIRGFAKAFVGMNARALPPEEVAKAIEHAVESSRPKTRYPITFDAKMGAIARRILPDRLMDMITVSQMS
jgi:NAD(P)-dependent dehydrogenase (short-subunit alcohol dehydrogenase family)